MSDAISSTAKEHRLLTLSEINDLVNTINQRISSPELRKMALLDQLYRTQMSQQGFPAFMNPFANVLSSHCNSDSDYNHLNHHHQSISSDSLDSDDSYSCQSSKRSIQPVTEGNSSAIHDDIPDPKIVFTCGNQTVLYPTPEPTPSPPPVTTQGTHPVDLSLPKTEESESVDAVTSQQQPAIIKSRVPIWKPNPKKRSSPLSFSQKSSSSESEGRDQIDDCAASPGISEKTPKSDYSPSIPNFSLFENIDLLNSSEFSLPSAVNSIISTEENQMVLERFNQSRTLQQSPGTSSYGDTSNNIFGWLGTSIFGKMTPSSQHELDKILRDSYALKVDVIRRMNTEYPVNYEYNPNKSRTRSDYNDQEVAFDRTKNNLASRRSRHRKKYQNQIVQYSVEFDDEENELLEKEKSYLRQYITDLESRVCDENRHLSEDVLQLRKDFKF